MSWMFWSMCLGYKIKLWKYYLDYQQLYTVVNILDANNKGKEGLGQSSQMET